MFARQPTSRDRSRSRMRRSTPMRVARCWLVPLVCLAGCTQEMVDQPRYEVYEASDIFADGASVRPPVEDTVARGELCRDDPYYTGLRDGQLVEEIPADPRTSEPFTLTREVLQRGRERFEIYCSHCHGRTGYGDGMVVRRGFRQPPSFHDPRLRDETPPGHFFDVISNGFRVMPQQGSRIAPADRWAIVAYIRVLQQSQHVKLADAPAEIRDKFKTDVSSDE